MTKRPSLLSASKPQALHRLSADSQDWESAGEMQILAIDTIDPSPYQPRDAYNEEMLADLAASIREVGMIQPVVVRPKGDQRYELVAGHRRWLAAARAEKTMIPAVIRALDNREAATLSLIENLQREDLNPMETAQGLQRLIQEFAVSQKDIAALLGRSKADINLTLGLLKLLPDVQSLVRNGVLTAGHGRLLYRLPHPVQAKLAKMTVSKGWTVRRLEEAIAGNKAGQTSKAFQETNIAHLEGILTEYFATPVKIRSSPKGRGVITFRYHTLAECEGLLERFGLTPEHYQGLDFD